MIRLYCDMPASFGIISDFRQGIWKWLTNIRTGRSSSIDLNGFGDIRCVRKKPYCVQRRLTISVSYKLLIKGSSPATTTVPQTPWLSGARVPVTKPCVATTQTTMSHFWLEPSSQKNPTNHLWATFAIFANDNKAEWSLTKDRW